MKLPIAELEFYPSQIARMESRFHSCCSNTTVIMGTPVAGRVDKHELERIKLVEKIVGIVRETRRPQRVPTFQELQMLKREYKQKPEMREVQRTGGRLNSVQAEQNTVEAMTSRGRAVTAVCIGSEV